MGGKNDAFNIHNTNATLIFIVISWRYWPSYGSNLVFELVRVRDGPPGPDSHVVRVLLDGIPVRSAKLKQSTNMSSDGPEGMFFIADFEQLVANLEDAGGHDYASLLGQC